VLVEQLKATRKVYSREGIMIDEVPDQIIRQKASIAILEWLEGKPRELQMQVKADFKNFPELVDRLNSSEAYREALASLQKTVQGKEITPTLPTRNAETG
jgi:hypothetical protein